MPEQELPIKTDIALDLSGNFPPDLHSIGQTRLVSLISDHSAESDVWLGEQTNGERVAVKIYRYGRIPGLVEKSQKCALNHPNLVPVIEAGEVRGRYFEISPFIAGGTLANFIQRRGRLLEEEVEAILNQLSDVIHYLHGRHVLHRDIKPTNIFVIRESPLQVALADFGTARLGAYQTMLTGSMGTVAYSSPEAVTGIQSEAADYWSLGTVLLEALTGRRPLEGLDVKQQLYRVASGKIEIPEVLPARWKALFAGLLRADYTDRWRKSEIERWQHSPESIAAEREPGRNQVPTIYGSQSHSLSSPHSEVDEKASIQPGNSPLLVRRPETITLTVSDLAEVAFNGAYTALARYFWLALALNWHAHNPFGTIILLGAIAAAGAGVQFLPGRLESMKREVRVNRQLAALSRDDRRSLRRLVRRWMRSLRRASHTER
jgi:serine/threonine protein kinase